MFKIIFFSAVAVLMAAPVSAQASRLFCEDMGYVGGLAAAARKDGGSQQVAADIVSHAFSRMANSQEFKAKYSNAERKSIAASFGHNATRIVSMVYRLDRSMMRRPEIVAEAVEDWCMTDW